MNPHGLPLPQHPRFSRRTAIQAGAAGLGQPGDEPPAGARGRWRLRPIRRPAASRAQGGHLHLPLRRVAQHDSFDMKPDAPDTIRGEFKPIATRTPGIQICEHLPMLAERSNQWALVRSLAHPHPEHSGGHLLMLSGRSQLPQGFDPMKPKPSDWPSMAAVAGAVCPPRNNLPPAVVLPEMLIHREGPGHPRPVRRRDGVASQPDVRQLTARFNARSYGAWPEYGFHHARGGRKPPGLRAFRRPNLSLPAGLDADGFSERLDLLHSIGAAAARSNAAAENETFDRYRQQAVVAVGRPQDAAAFNARRRRSQNARPLWPKYVSAGRC